ncbi:MAG: radical SAM protein, partial [Candidatus Delongbacteria bacterium]|nr:radical SAM protein [Candidatus Delongbacteria bacterium]
SPYHLYKPISMLFVCSFDCYTDCVYCYASRESKYSSLNWNELKKILLEAINELKVREIAVSGGDIFKYPYVNEFLEIISDNGYFPELPTKKPLNITTLKFLKKLGFKSFQYSIDSFDPKYLSKHLSISNPDKYIDEIIESIHNAEKLNIKISINSVITKLNYKGIRKFLERILKFNNVYKVNLNPVGYSLYKRKEMQELMLTNDDYDIIDKECNRIFNKARKKIKYFKEPDRFGCCWGETTASDSIQDYMDRSLCSAYRLGFVVLPDGKVTGCEELYYDKDFIIGNLKKQTIMEIWNSNKRKNLLQPLQNQFSKDSPCKYCDEIYFKECNEIKGRCWRESLKFYGKHDFPDYRCPLSKNIAKDKNLSISFNEFIWEI